MHRHVAVPLESGRDGERGGERAACAVNQHVHRLAGVLGEYVVHIIAVEVVTSDKAFEMKVILGLWYGLILLCHKSTAINKRGKRH